LTEWVAGFVEEPLTALAYTSLNHLDRAVWRLDGLRGVMKLRPGVVATP
jgi:hypothetical protein